MRVLLVGGHSHGKVMDRPPHSGPYLVTAVYDPRTISPAAPVVDMSTPVDIQQETYVRCAYTDCDDHYLPIMKLEGMTDMEVFNRLINDAAELRRMRDKYYYIFEDEERSHESR